MSSLNAKVSTNQGDFTIELFDDKAPRTVSNFYNLGKDGFYNDVIFHRIIEGFMIQGGDPTGTGTGGPGYQFKDEFHPELRHEKEGTLSMANAGPNTNGSQFFITLGATPHLNDRHAVFGVVTEGLDVVKKIGSCQTGAQDRPVEEIKIQGIQFEGDFEPVDIGKL